MKLKLKGEQTDNYKQLVWLDFQLQASCSGYVNYDIKCNKYIITGCLSSSEYKEGGWPKTQ